MKYLFVGEDRSPLAVKMNVRWENGNLAAKQLFDALDYAGIDKSDCKFMNLFEPLRQQGILANCHDLWIIIMQTNGYRVVAMGNKVSEELTKRGISHLKITHPAARGKIRTKELYCKHVYFTLNHTTK